MKKVVAAIGLALALHAAAPARAELPGAPAQEGPKTSPLPAPGTHRLIRIGPGALVMEDDRGQVTMVDENAPEPKRGKSIADAAVIFGVLSAGAFWFWETQSDLTERVAR